MNPTGTSAARPLRTLTLVSLGFGHPAPEELVVLEQADRYPRASLFGRVLNTDLLDERFLERVPAGRRRLYRGLPPSVAQVLEARVVGREYDAVISWAEHLGLPYAALTALVGGRRPHIALWSWISKPPKAQLLGLLHRGVDRIVLMSSRQRDFAVQRLGIPEHRVPLLRWPVDQQFWRPLPAAAEGICAVGREMRDYATLIAAIRDLPVPCHIAVNLRPGIRDRWVRDIEQAQPLPDHITVGRRAFSDLRDLYSRSRFVVVPLYPTTTDNGTTSILEAMAMGKAVICSRVQGQTDVLQDGVTGLFVPPQDPGALRAAIMELLRNPERADSMGAAGRRFIEQYHTLDRFVAEVRRIVEEAVAERGRR